MKGKKGICLILCILLLTGLAPLRAAAVSGEPVDGVWASIALTGGANKIIFSADSEIQRQIENPDELTPAQFLLPEGISYDAQSNTLSLTDFNEPTANLVLTMMGGDFRIRLSGSSALGSICSESLGRGGSVTLCGDGALELSGADNAIIVRAGGAPDFVRVESQVHLTAGSYGSVIRVYDTSLADGAILVDTSEPQVVAYDDRRVIESVTTTEGKTLEPYTLAGSGGLYGIRDDILSDAEGDRIVYNVYALGDKTPEGLYPVLEETEHNVGDISAYQRACTPHDWILVKLSGGATATQARFARFAISTRVLGDGGTLSASQTEVARGGSVELSVVPWEGYKLVALTVNDAEVSAANGSYVIGGITADKNVTAAFAAATPAAVEVTAPSDTDFKVPAKGAQPFVSEPYSAVVKDGAGDSVGADVSWSLSPATEGVSIGSDGRVTVSPDALNAVEETSLFTVTATAAADGVTISNSDSRFTVALAERQAAELRLVRNGERVGQSDTVQIPAAGETATRQYAAIVYDQYGGLRAEQIVWSASEMPAGVSRSGDTLTVTDSCPDGSPLTVTAACASDSTVAASVTVSFAAPAAAPSEPGEDPTDPDAQTPSRAVPTVNWPTVTLAANPVYGITWSQLVSLGGDGSAAIGENDVEGVFSINRDDNALPNVSDKFRIVFTYTDPDSGETATVESDERTVTLAKKPLDSSMVTLTPESMLYAFGEECRPAVSLTDGGRSLISGTDYTVDGYSANIQIGTGSVTISGTGNYKDSVTKNFQITAIPGSSVTSSVTPCKPEDTGWIPAIVLTYGERTLVQGTDYELSLQYDIPAKTGTAEITFKGVYSGTRILSFDLPNYLITEGAGSTWSKSYTTALPFKANGAFVKFTELTIDGKTVPLSYYSVESGSTIVKIKVDYLKSLAVGKHIVGIAYKDGKALAIFSITDVQHQGVATGDSNNTTAWIILLAASLIAFGALAVAFVRSGRKKKKRRK